MKNRKAIYTIGLAGMSALAFTSCDSYLDEMPDNRTEVTSEDQVAALVTSAYPQAGFYGFVNECMSDNIDDMGSRYSKNDDRFASQVFNWEDVTEEDNDGPRYIWENSYNAIASANQALESIEGMGGATTTKLKAVKAEALLCRAYNHFILVNEFCLNYNAQTSTTDLGIPYMEKSETTVSPTYERGTVAEDYEKIDRDIQEALPILTDAHLSVPKYHFNVQAAYAFAARFYLFYEKWEKAAAYATQCLGSNPKSMLRDWDAMEAWGITDDISPRTNAYISATDNCNLLLLTATSAMGVWTGNYSYITKYTHDAYISEHETLEATNLWGSSDGSSSLLRCAPMSFQAGTMDRVIVAKLPYLFYETDPVAKTGYWKTVYPAFKADLTLLERAEAYVMLKQYDKACEDLTTWMQNWTKSTATLTVDAVKQFYLGDGTSSNRGIKYSNSFAPTLRKHLHPAFAIDAEGSDQECMLQAVLNFKRLETVYEGFRWWDIKRYGINITRRTMNADGEPDFVTDSLGTNDLRRAIQLPTLVLQAGMAANPR